MKNGINAVDKQTTTSYSGETMTDTIHQEIQIDDLTIKENIPVVPITADRSLAINMINEAIDFSKEWSINEKVDGKEIEIFDEWKGKFIDQIVLEYRQVGWNVLHFVHGKREYLAFYHPHRKDLYTQKAAVPAA